MFSFTKPSQKVVTPNVAAASADGGIVLYSNKYFATCAVGGILSCGLTHAALTPVDFVKCRMQVGTFGYTGVFDGVRKIMAEGGAIGLSRGFLPTLYGYSIQGMFKFGLYEYFKFKYALIAGRDNSERFKDLLFASASASAEIIADAGYVSFEAIKVKMQTAPTTELSMTQTARLMAKEGGGWGVLYAGLPPLWMRQVPYTILKFTFFERIVNVLSKYQLPEGKSRADVSKAQGLLITFEAGYLAGILCAIATQSADTVVSRKNKSPEKGYGQIWKEVGGLKGSYAGLVPRIFMIGTLTGLQWLIFDGVKAASGLPGSGGKVYPYTVEEEAAMLQKS